MNHIAEHPASGRVVVGIDGSENSERAFDTALRVAQRFQYELKVVTAYTEWGYEYLPPSRIGMVQTQAQHDLDEMVARAKDAEVELSSAAIEGDAAGVLTEESREAALVVVGKRGRSRFAGRFLGSVSASVAAYSQCPSLIVPEKRESGEYLETQFSRLSGSPELSEFGVIPSEELDDATDFTDSVVVGVDLDAHPVEFALHAARHAELRDLTLTLVTAQPFSGSLWIPVSPIYRAEIPDLRKDVAARLAEVAEQVAEHTTAPVQWRFFDASAEDVLSDASRTASAVVVGTRGRGGFAGLLLGSISQAVLNRAVAPVLVVPNKTDGS